MLGMWRRGIISALALGMVVGWQCVEDPAESLSPDNPWQRCTTAVALNTEAFDSLVVRQGRTAIVEFYSPTCGVCNAMAGVIESLAVVFGDSLLVATFNVNSNDSLWRRYVTSVPTYVLFDSGHVRGKLSFYTAEPWAYDSLAAMIRTLLTGTLLPDTNDTSSPPDTLPRGLTELDSANFDALVRVPGRVSMVEFYSPLCGACQTMFPVVDSIVARYDGRALIGRVNIITDNTITPAFNVQWVPTFVFLKGGVEYARLSGVTTADTLASRLELGLSKGIYPTP